MSYSISGHFNLKMIFCRCTRLALLIEEFYSYFIHSIYLKLEHNSDTGSHLKLKSCIISTISSNILLVYIYFLKIPWRKKHFFYKWSLHSIIFLSFFLYLRYKYTFSVITMEKNAKLTILEFAIIYFLTQNYCKVLS
jgi:hypothetical protein